MNRRSFLQMSALGLIPLCGLKKNTLDEPAYSRRPNQIEGQTNYTSPQFYVPLHHVKCGIAPIDRLIGGFRRGQFHAFLGGDGCYKSTLCMAVADGASRQGTDVIIFSTNNLGALLYQKKANHLPLYTERKEKFDECRKFLFVETRLASDCAVVKLQELLEEGHRPDLVVIDDVDATFGESPVRLFEHLSRLAIKYNFALLVSMTARPRLKCYRYEFTHSRIRMADHVTMLDQGFKGAGGSPEIQRMVRLRVVKSRSGSGNPQASASTKIVFNS